MVIGKIEERSRTRWGGTQRRRKENERITKRSDYKKDRRNERKVTEWNRIQKDKDGRKRKNEEKMRVKE